MHAFPIRWRTAKHLSPMEALVRQEATRLFGFYPGLKVWRVDLESIAASTLAAASICVTVEARARERQVIVNRANADAGIAVRGAFDALFRRFERRRAGDRRRGEVKEKVIRAA